MIFHGKIVYVDIFLMDLHHNQNKRLNYVNNTLFK